MALCRFGENLIGGYQRRYSLGRRRAGGRLELWPSRAGSRGLRV